MGLRSWLQTKLAGRSSAKETGTKAPRYFQLDGDFYPPWTPEEILADPLISELISSADRKFNHSRQRFREWIMPIIEMAAKYYGPLPASQSHHDSVRYGLLIHTLRVLNYVIENIPGQMDPGPLLKGENLQRNERSYYQILALASFLHDAGKPVTDLILKEKTPLRPNERARTWDPRNETLWEFCKVNPESGIVWRWQPGRYKQHDQQTIISMVCGAWLSELKLNLSPEMFPMLQECIDQEESSDIYKMLRKYDGLAAKDARKVAASSFVERKEDPLAVIRQIIKDKIKRGIWKYNADVLYKTDAGLLVVFPKAFKELFEDVTRANEHSIEEKYFVSYEEIVAKMIELGHIHTRELKNNAESFKEIFKPASHKPKSNPLTGARIVDPESIGFIGYSDAKTIELALHQNENGFNIAHEEMNVTEVRAAATANKVDHAEEADERSEHEADPESGAIATEHHPTHEDKPESEAPEKDDEAPPGTDVYDDVFESVGVDHTDATNRIIEAVAASNDLRDRLVIINKGGAVRIRAPAKLLFDVVDMLPGDAIEALIETQSISGEPALLYGKKKGRWVEFIGSTADQLKESLGEEPVASEEDEKLLGEFGMFCQRMLSRGQYSVTPLSERNEKQTGFYREGDQYFVDMHPLMGFAATSPLMAGKKVQKLLNTFKSLGLITGEEAPYKLHDDFSALILVNEENNREGAPA